MTKLKDLDYDILSELIKNSRLSDRQVAKILGVSQPTVTRRRSQLEKEGLLEYTAIPDLGKLDFEIVAFTFGKWNFEAYADTQVQAAKDFINRHPNIIFVSTGRGDFGDRVAISVHKDYSEYSKFMSEVRQEWAEFMGSSSTFIISLKTDNIVRKLTFKFLIDAVKKKP
jgi:DNA-binding Lrp family transcriptional regulator